LQDRHWRSEPEFKGPEPFTPAWYARHPRAWRPAHPRADAWAFTTFAAVSAWLGWPADTVATDDNAADDDDDSDQEQSVTAQSSTADGGSDEWLGLGVYKLMPPNQKEASALLQLGVNRDGALRGSYYDLLTDQTYTIRGTIDKQSQRVTWTIGPQDSVEFQATLGELTQPGDQPVNIRLLNGEMRQWHLWRQDAPDQS
jgi:hypothetical protein